MTNDNLESITFKETDDNTVIAVQGTKTWIEVLLGSVPFEKRAPVDMLRMYHENVPALKRQGRARTYDPHAWYRSAQAMNGLVLLKPAPEIAAGSGWPVYANELLLLSTHLKNIYCLDERGRHVTLAHHCKDARLVDAYEDLVNA